MQEDEYEAKAWKMLGSRMEKDRCKRRQMIECAAGIAIVAVIIILAYFFLKI